MPKLEKVLRKAQSAPKAIVLPTTQASAIPARWRRVSYFNLPKTFATMPETYCIKLIGEAFSYTTSQSREVEIQRIYRAYHPSCAVGRAVLDFFKDNARATISHIEILKGI